MDLKKKLVGLFSLATTGTHPSDWKKTIDVINARYEQWELAVREGKVSKENHAGRGTHPEYLGALARHDPEAASRLYKMGDWRPEASTASAAASQKSNPKQ